MSSVRPAAVAGSFYPADPTRLAQLVDRLLDEAAPSRGPLPKALVVPHAGYVYSGPIAASAYALLRPFASRLSKVLLLGPSHFVGLRGLALPEASELETPLGRLPVDPSAAGALGALAQVGSSALAHRREHSLEVQLPFLQRLSLKVQLVPLVAGEATAAEVAEVLEALWGAEETLVLVSTDLSHYLPYELAKRADAQTARAILAADASAVADEGACGAVPLRGLLEVARRRGLVLEQLDLRSSGDTAGDKGQVVGYGAFALREVRA